MKNQIHLLQIICLLIGVMSCDSQRSDQPDDNHLNFEGIKSHSQGHGADPPPCTKCQDFIGNLNPTAPSPIESFDKYGFLKANIDGIDLYYLYPHLLSDDLPDSGPIFFEAPEHYIIDVDTLKGGEIIMIPTGIKIKIANKFSDQMKEGYIKGVKVGGSILRSKTNRLNIAGLANAGYIHDKLGKLYLSQDYYYLQDLEKLKMMTVWSHIENMQLFIGSVYQKGYSIDLAVDVQLNHLNYPHHVFGNHPHDE